VVVEGASGCATGGAGAGQAYIDQTIPNGTILQDAGSGIGFLSVCLTSTSTDVTHCDVTIQGVAGDSNLKNGSLLGPNGSCPDGVLVLDDQGGLVEAVGWEGQVADAGAYGGYFQSRLLQCRAWAGGR
jgi:hypothetical protein